MKVNLRLCLFVYRAELLSPSERGSDPQSCAEREHGKARMPIRSRPGRDSIFCQMVQGW